VEALIDHVEDEEVLAEDHKPPVKGTPTTMLIPRVPKRKRSEATRIPKSKKKMKEMTRNYAIYVQNLCPRNIGQWQSAIIGLAMFARCAFALFIRRRIALFAKSVIPFIF
jgi:hypothetical protein